MKNKKTDNKKAHWRNTIKGNCARLGCFLVILILPFALSGCGLKDTPPVGVEAIQVWGVWDDSDVMSKLIGPYKEKNKQVADIVYRKLTYDEYEKELISAFATGKGPDIFLAHHTWLAKHKDLMVSLEEVTNAYNEAAASIGGCDRPPLVTEPLLTNRQYSEAFVDVAYNDFTKDGQIYGIPLAVDTMALYYNKDLFAAAGIAEPPRTWEQFASDSRRLTIKDSYNNITQVGAAIGTANNVNRAGDIVSLLMMQWGCPMVNLSTMTPSFQSQKQDTSKAGQFYSPAVEAISFYGSFSDGSSQNYTWNPQIHNSIDIFQEGKAAMMINYTYAIETIKSKAPKLNFGVARIPQLSNAAEAEKMTYANYWGYVVSRSALEKKSKALEAWKLLRYLGEKDQVAVYAEVTKRPASRRDVISVQSKEPDIGIFAEQALTAKSWFQPDEKKVDEIFNATIEDMAIGRMGNAREGAEQAVGELNRKLGVLFQDYKLKQIGQ